MPTRPLHPETAIARLHQQPVNTVTEQDLRQLLRRYNLREGLLALGRTSFFIFSQSKSDAAVGKAVYRDPDTGVLVSQFCLAYLANLLIMSGTNDYRKPLLGKPDNIQSLCNTYGNCLIDPALGRSKVDEGWFKTLMVHMYYEQMPDFQYSVDSMMARAITLFRDIAPHVTRPTIEPLPEILQKKAGLNPMDYLRLGFAVFVAAGQHHGACLNIEYLTGTSSPQLAPFMTDDKVRSFLAMVAADYPTFRALDEHHNADLDPKLTKYRFNPLFAYPVIKTQLGDKPYVIPNVPIYLRKAYLGLYWWYHHYFEKEGHTKDFRDYFGDVFQQYVGVILKEMYGAEAVQGEIVYGGKAKQRFIDWTVERNGKLYLFEVKAFQFSLDSLRIATPEILRREIDTKVVDSVEQVFKRVQDIDRHDELRHFRGKELVPVIVFLDMPWISGNLFNDWIRESLANITKQKGLKGLEHFAPHLLNIDELEMYDAAIDNIELHEVFAQYKGDPAEGFQSIVAKHRVKGRPGNRFLKKVYDNFWTEAYGVKK